MDFLPQHHYEQYEISNFAKNGAISKHNSAYWLGKKYLGVGPSAHSYNGKQRQWNVANNGQYIKSLKGDLPYFELEDLSVSDRFNDYILTRLRTKWGIDLNDLKKIAPTEIQSLQLALNNFVMDGQVIQNGDEFTLTDEGKYIADSISADLFI